MLWIEKNAWKPQELVFMFVFCFLRWNGLGLATWYFQIWECGFVKGWQNTRKWYHLMRQWGVTQSNLRAKRVLIITKWRRTANEIDPRWFMTCVVSSNSNNVSNLAIFSCPDSCIISHKFNIPLLLENQQCEEREFQIFGLISSCD